MCEVLFVFHSFISFLNCVQKKRNAKKKSKKQGSLSLSDCIALTGAKSMARTTHDGMSVENKIAANDKISKTLKTKINKEVKNTIPDIAHREQLERLNCEHLTKSVPHLTK
jgi:hypothetical protein